MDALRRDRYEDHHLDHDAIAFGGNSGCDGKPIQTAFRCPNRVADVQPRALQLKSNHSEGFGMCAAVDQIGTAGKVVGECSSNVG
jgi:hypothetical protein